MTEPHIVPATLARREDFGDFLNHRGLLGNAVEIGTDKGAFAAALLERWKGRLLVCVDPWADEIPGYTGCLCGRPRLPDLLLTCAVLARFPGRVQLLQMTSQQAANHPQIRELAGAFDFVYIDGNHDESFVREDISAYWPRVNPGGILAGHDWDVPSVQAAVKLFAIRERVTIHILPGDAWTWFVIRGEA